MNKINSGITVPLGFRASAVKAKIKHDKLDLALVVSDRPASVAGMFTINKIQAAPVKLCKGVVALQSAQAIVINSGNANACTGRKGMDDASRMASVTAECLGLNEDSVLVCSTGTIGVPMPMEKIENGIRAAAAELSEDGGDIAARAIMTTDKVSKQVSAEISIDGHVVRIGGMAKGSGMIEPNMATMLGFLTTDADVDPSALQDCLSAAVRRSFNRISVDGDQSTNDTVLFLANGMAGNSRLSGSHKEWKVFTEAVDKLTLELAHMIVTDGEGATKFVTVTVKGALSNSDALAACRAVSNSLLVKTSWFGCDPNWGRIIDAVGYSGAEVIENLVDIWYDDLCAVKDGCVASGTAVKELQKILAGKKFSIVIDLKIGKGRDTVYTCDCSYEYVRINAEYTT